MTDSDINQAEIDALIEKLSGLKSLAESAIDDEKAQREKIFARMDEVSAQVWTTPHGTISIQEPVTSVLDEAGLLPELTEDQKASVTKVTIDKKKLEAAVTAGLIEAEVVAPFISEVPKARHIRYEPKRVRPEDA